jgi:hypothetical protein
MSVELTDEQFEYVNNTVAQGTETMRRFMEEVLKLRKENAAKDAEIAKMRQQSEQSEHRIPAEQASDWILYPDGKVIRHGIRSIGPTWTIARAAGILSRRNEWRDRAEKAEAEIADLKRGGVVAVDREELGSLRHLLDCARVAAHAVEDEGECDMSSICGAVFACDSLRAQPTQEPTTNETSER